MHSFGNFLERINTFVLSDTKTHRNNFLLAQRQVFKRLLDRIVQLTSLSGAKRIILVTKALELADPEAREVLERAAVADVETQPIREAWNLLSAAVRRELAHRVTLSDPEQIRVDRSARLLLENLEVPGMAESSAEQLLGWLNLRAGEHE